jgi:hypothetical protein
MPEPSWDRGGDYYSQLGQAPRPRAESTLQRHAPYVRYRTDRAGLGDLGIDHDSEQHPIRGVQKPSKRPFTSTIHPAQTRLAQIRLKVLVSSRAVVQHEIDQTGRAMK